jgi:hypothetical protein
VCATLYINIYKFSKITNNIFIHRQLRTASKITSTPKLIKIEKTMAIVVQNAQMLPPPMHLLKNTQW